MATPASAETAAIWPARLPNSLREIPVFLSWFMRILLYSQQTRFEESCVRVARSRHAFACAVRSYVQEEAAHVFKRFIQFIGKVASRTYSGPPGFNLLSIKENDVTSNSGGASVHRSNSGRVFRAEP